MFLRSYTREVGKVLYFNGHYFVFPMSRNYNEQKYAQEVKRWICISCILSLLSNQFSTNI